MNIPEARARLTLGVEGFKNSIEEAQQGFANLGNNIKGVTAQIRTSGLALTGFTAGAIVAGRNAVNTFADFEQQMKIVGVIVNEGAVALERLTAAALLVGQTTQVTATQAAEALYELASAGFTAQQSLDSLNATVNIAIATQQSIRSSALLVTSTIQQFGLEAAESTRVADLFVSAINESPATLEKLASALRYAGPIAKDYGATLEETVASLELLFQTGLRGEQAGTALRNTFVRLVNPTARAVEIIESLGLTAGEVNPRIVGLFTALQRLTDAGIAAGDATQIFGVRAINAFITLSKAGPEGIAEMIEGLKEVGSASRVAQEQLDTFRGSVTIMRSALETTGIIVGGFIGNAIRPFIDMTTQLVFAFNKLPAPIQQVATALAVVGTLAGAFTATVLLLSPAIIHWASISTATSLALTGIAEGAAIAARGISTFTVNAAKAGVELGVLPRGLYGVAAAFRTVGGELKVIRAEFAATAAASGVLNASLITLQRSLNVIVATPAGRVILGVAVAMASLAIASQAVRKNVGGAGDSFRGLISSFNEVIDSVQTTASVLLTTLMPVIKLVGAGAGGILLVSLHGVANILRVIAVIANEVARAFKLVVAPIEAVGNSFRNAFGDLGQLINEPLRTLREGFDSGGVNSSFREMRENIRGINTDANVAFLTVTGQAAKAQAQIEKAKEATAGWRIEFDEIKRTLSGQEYIDALVDLRQRVEGNAGAVGLITEEIDRAEQALAVFASEMARLTEQAEKTAGVFRNELQDIAISLITDEELRKLEEAETSFERLGERIRSEVETNEAFAPMAEELLSRAAELQAQTLAKIERESGEERDKARKDAYEKLEDSTREGEERLLKLQAQLSGSEVTKSNLNFEQDLRDIEENYESTYLLVQENEDRINALRESKAQRLVEIEQTKQNRLAQLDLSYSGDIEVIQRRYEVQERAAQGNAEKLAEAANERNKAIRARDAELVADRGLVEDSFATEVQEITAHFGDLEAQTAENQRALAIIEAQKREERLLAERIHTEELERISADLYASLEERAREAGARLAQNSGSQVLLASSDLENSLAEINSYYDELGKKVAENSQERRDLEKLRLKETTQAYADHAETVKALNEDLTKALRDRSQALRDNQVRSEGSPIQKEQLSYKEEVDEANEEFERLKEAYEGNQKAITRILDDQLQFNLQLYEQHRRRVAAIYKAIDDAVVESARQRTIRLAALNADPFEGERLSLEKSLADNVEHYEELIRQTFIFSRRRRRLRRAMAEEEAVLTAESNQRILDLERQLVEGTEQMYRNAQSRLDGMDLSPRERIEAEAVEQERAARSTAQRLLDIYGGNAADRVAIEEALQAELDSIAEEQVFNTARTQRELVEEIELGSSRLAEASLAGRDDQVGVLRVQHERERGEIEKHYRQLIKNAQGFEEELARLREQQDAALVQFDENAQREQDELRARLAREEANRLAEIYQTGVTLIAQIQAVGNRDVFELERLAFEQRERDTDEFYRRQVEDAEAAGHDTTEIFKNWQNALLLNQRETQQKQLDLYQQYVDQFIQLREETQNAEIERTATPGQRAQLDYDQRLTEIERFYTEQKAIVGSNEQALAELNATYGAMIVANEQQLNATLLDLRKQRARQLVDIVLQQAEDEAALTTQPEDDLEAEHDTRVAAIRRQFADMAEEYEEGSDELIALNERRTNALRIEDERHAQAAIELARRQQQQLYELALGHADALAALTATPVDDELAQHNQRVNDILGQYRGILDQYKKDSDEYKAVLARRNADLEAEDRRHADAVLDIQRDLQRQIQDLVFDNDAAAAANTRNPLDDESAEHTRRLTAIDRMYTDMLELHVEGSDEYKRIVGEQTRAVTNEWNRHADAVRQIHKDLVADYNAIYRDTLEKGVSLGISTEQAVLADQLQRDLDTLRDDWERRAELAKAAGVDIATIEERLTHRRRVILATFHNDIFLMEREFHRQRVDSALAVSRQLAENAEDDRGAIGIDYRAEMERIDRFYTDQLQRAKELGKDTSAINEERRQAELAAEGEYFLNLRKLDEDNLNSRRRLYEMLFAREQSILKLRAGAAASGILEAQGNLQVALRQVDEHWREMREIARKTGDDITGYEQLQQQERVALYERFKKDVEQIYQDLADSIESRLKGLDSIALEIGVITNREALERDLAASLRDLEEFYTNARTLISTDENLDAQSRDALLTSFDRDEAKERELLVAQHYKAMTDMNREFTEKLVAQRADLERRLATLNQDPLTISEDVSLANLDTADALRSAQKFYGELLAEARRLEQDTSEIYAAYRRERELIEREHQQRIQNIQREGLSNQLSELQRYVSKASLAQAQSMQAQVVQLRRIFSGDTEALKLIDQFAAGVRERMTQLGAEQVRVITDGLKATSDEQRRAFLIQLGYSEEGAELLKRNQLDLTRTHLEEIHKRLVAERAVWGSRGAAVKEFDDAIEAIEAQMSGLTENWRENVREMLSATAEFNQSVRDDVAAFGVNALEKQSFELQQQVEALREELSQADPGSAIAEDLTNRIQAIQAAIDAIDLSDFKTGLSEVDSAFLAFNRQTEEMLTRLRGLQRELLNADPSDPLTQRIIASIRTLIEGFDDVALIARQSAYQLAFDAIEAYNKGIKDAGEAAQKEALSSITDSIDQALNQTMLASREGIAGAREMLNRLIEDLVAKGFDRKLLREGLESYYDDLEQRLERVSSTYADFASQQFALARSVADATQQEGEARRLTITTLEEEVRLRQLAYEEAQRNSDVNKELEAKGKLIEAQLTLAAAYQKGIDAQDEVIESALKTIDIYDQLGQAMRTPGTREATIAALEGTRDALLAEAEAARQTVNGWDEYLDKLSEAAEITKRISDVRDRETYFEEEQSRLRQRIELERELGEFQVENREMLDERQGPTPIFEQIRQSRTLIDGYAQQVNSLRRIRQEQKVNGTSQEKQRKTMEQLIAAGKQYVDNLKDQAQAMRDRASEMRNEIEGMKDAAMSFIDIANQLSGENVAGGSTDADALKERQQDALRIALDTTKTVEERAGALAKVQEYEEKINELGQEGLDFFDKSDIASAAEEIGENLPSEIALAENAISQLTYAADTMAATFREATQQMAADIRTLVNEIKKPIDAPFISPEEDAKASEKTNERMAELGDLLKEGSTNASEFHQKVLQLGKELGLALDLNDIKADPAHVLKQIQGAFEKAALDPNTTSTAHQNLLENLLPKSEELLEQLESVIGADAMRQLNMDGFEQIGEEQAQALIEGMVEKFSLAPLSATAKNELQNLENIMERASPEVAKTFKDALLNIAPESIPPAMQKFIDELKNEAKTGGEEAGEAIGEGLDQGQANLDVSPLADAVSNAVAEGAENASVAVDGEAVAEGLADAVTEGVEAGEGVVDPEAVTAGMVEAMEKVVEDSTAAGTRAGAGLIGAMAEGVEDNKQVLMDALDGVLNGVRDRLPSSDAKKGPLSDLTYAGEMLVRTFGKGSARQKPWLESMMDNVFAAAVPKVALPTPAAATPNALSGFGPMAGGDIHLTVDANRAPATAILARDARQLAKTAVREAEIQMKLRGR